MTNWRDAVEFMLLGASTVQVCTEVMLRGHGIVEDMIDGLDTYLATHGFASVSEMVGKAVPNFREWGELDLNYETVAKIDAAKCIGCQLCVAACHDGAHQCIHPQPGTRVPRVDEAECVGCNLCQIVCPVADCISMERVEHVVSPASWNEYVADPAGHPLRPKKGSHE